MTASSSTWGGRTSYFFFFNDTATTEIYTLSLHDALPIFPRRRRASSCSRSWTGSRWCPRPDRKSTRLNSSHGYISYAVFCLKKKSERPQSDALGLRGAGCRRYGQAGRLEDGELAHGDLRG